MNIPKSISLEPVAEMEYQFFERELSWLSFNYRVLQEAKDPLNPIYERLKFLAIYSSNLDEFFRVRVAGLRTLLSLSRKSIKKLKFDPEKLLARIHKRVDKQQREFGKIFRNEILPGLEKRKIFLADYTRLNEYHARFVEQFFHETVEPLLHPQILPGPVFLQNGILYFAVTLKSFENGSRKDKIAIVEIPSTKLPRFIKLPTIDDRSVIIFLDDIIRASLNSLFPDYSVEGVYSVKLTRDAELYIDDEFSGNLVEKIQKALKKRSTGVPCRFLYDERMPKRVLKSLSSLLNLEKEDLIPGGKYHNFSDFFNFPNPGFPGLTNPPIEPLSDPAIDIHENLFAAIKEKDRLLYFPYQKFDYVIDFLDKAAEDPDVYEIKITQYRVAKNSAIIKSLIKASQAGKKVTAFVEVKARFDEEPNLQWASEMEKAGVKVLYSFPGLKVHAKLAMVSRLEGNKKVNYCYLGTGNFNENTAKIYTDFGMFTIDKRITSEVEKVFECLERRRFDFEFKHLMVSQFNIRRSFARLIENEVYNAINGKDAAITAKLNSIEDKKIIRRLYDANNNGVKINIICRGICCLVPGLKGQSENIEIRSIVDKYLEHGRAFIFHNGGKEKVYLGSADWMKRNLSHRIEVVFPIYDEELKAKVKAFLALQFADNVKARIIDKKLKNNYYSTNYYSTEDEIPVRSQEATYQLLRNWK